MTKWDIPEWNDWDNAARAELTDDFAPFGYSPRSSKVAMFRVYRGSVEVGWVTLYRTSAEWLVETFRIMLFEQFHFDKALHQAGHYQPRWGLFLMERLFQRNELIEFEIRESSYINDAPGVAFVARVRGEYALPYHHPDCFGGQDFSSPCVCGHGRTRAPA